MQNEIPAEPLIVFIAGLLLFFGIIGIWLGSTKDRPGAGFFLGLFLGPIGLVITLLLPHGGGKCPECRNPHPSGATICKHCGKEIGNAQNVRKILSKKMDSNKFFVSEETGKGEPKVKIELETEEGQFVKSYPNRWDPHDIVQEFRKANRMERGVNPYE